MKASVDRLRWGLAAGALVLLLVVGGFLGYGRFKQVRRWRDTLRRLNLRGPHETTGFTYSSSPKDRTSYKVKAARVVEHGDGTWSMYDVAVTLYSKTSSDEDHIYGSDIEYDQNSGVARAIGVVHMDLQVAGAKKAAKSTAGFAKAAPPTKAAQPANVSHPGEESPDIIHVQTSGLVYVHKLGVAATDQPVEFVYQDVQCTSKGAEFDSGSSQLHLLADVVLHGVLQNSPLVVHAEKADLYRDQNLVMMTRPVAVSKDRTASAETVTAYTRKDGSLENAEAGGGVKIVQGTQMITALSYAGSFNKDSLPENGKLVGSVVALDTAAMRPVRGQADEVDAAFDAAGTVSTITAMGHVMTTATERTAGVGDLQRQMKGDRMLATMEPARKGKQGAGPRLKELHVVGAAAAAGDSIASGGLRKTTRIAADDLDAFFDSETKKPSLTRMLGHGHTQLEQDGPQGEVQTSASDDLTASFANATGKDGGVQIASATQTGHVVLHITPALKPRAAPGQPSDAMGDRAVYEQATSKMTLSGGAHFRQGGTTLNAAVIVVDQETQDAAATGNVLATLAGASTATSKPGSQPDEQQVTHVSAARATLQHALETATFFGDQKQQARLWQGASQVQAATLLFDQKKKTLTARPEAGALVHAVFANAPANVSASAPHPAADGTAPEVVRVSAATMDYDDVRREADFNGKVLIESPTAQAQAQHGVAILAAAKTGTGKAATANVATIKTSDPVPLGGSLERIVLEDNVRLSQQGRTGTGTQLVYTAVDGTYLLTGSAGKPPHIVDPQQGSVTGTSLLFHGADSTIIVNGNAASKQAGRVRTEVQVRGK